jgi:drug/metabolite transporter (DMT)-like permease
MRVEGWLFLGCGIFFGGSDIVYWYTSYDPTGTAALALAVGLALLIGFYLLFTGRRLPLRPEDDYDGQIALGAAIFAVGFAVGWWLVLMGVVFIFIASIGFVFEYYRGMFSH